MAQFNGVHRSLPMQFRRLCGLMHQSSNHLSLKSRGQNSARELYAMPVVSVAQRNTTGTQFSTKHSINSPVTKFNVVLPNECKMNTGTIANITQYLVCTYGPDPLTQ